MITSSVILASNKTQLQAIIGLSGIKDVGKTTTLRELAIRLLCFGKSQQQQNAINSFFANHLTQYRNYKDVRIIIEYCGAYIYIATGGDEDSIINDNIAFFEGKAFLGSKPILIFEYSASQNQVVPVANPNYINSYPPHICLSACRTQPSTMQPLDDFAQSISSIDKCLYYRFFDKNAINATVDSLVKLIDKLY